MLCLLSVVVWGYCVALWCCCVVTLIALRGGRRGRRGRKRSEEDARNSHVACVYTKTLIVLENDRISISFLARNDPHCFFFFSCCCCLHPTKKRCYHRFPCPSTHSVAPCSHCSEVFHGVIVRWNLIFKANFSAISFASQEKAWFLGPSPHKQWK